MESRRKRVEQKGRFTITEIIPGSPYSSHGSSSPTFLDDTPISSSNDCGGMATIQPISHQQLNAVESNNPIQLVVNQIVELKMEETSDHLYTQTERVTESSFVSNKTSVLIASETQAVAIDPTCKVMTSVTTCAASASGDLLQKYSSPKKSREGVQRARRIKRRGRFTIIEMASDSPTSKKDSDELYDHRFVTTTSVEGSSGESPPQQLSRSLDSMERRTKPKRATRSMPRLRQPSSVRRSRRRSASPARELVEPMDVVGLTGNQQDSAEHAAENTDVLDRITLTSAIDVGTGASKIPHASASVSMTCLTIPNSERTATDASSAVRPTAPSSQVINVSETNGNIVGLPQSSSMAISVEQFLQQQQTIASLIRQQHDLKQVIGVLQEQQEQLMSIPSQINELNSQSARMNSDWTRDDETQELSMKVQSLMLANESLHSMLNAAEREVRRRNLQIECLSEENDELRQRCGQLELFLETED
ncbi:unnamed protein product [Peronospora belbahrii]|uniref:Uncharacterized protein n=1 Tax=Peronospora belbahrii TaxID=622444 RepID=A0AAU9LBW5_9STRA|nr:unnamed protein product [Peronospora belbahrii]CAH0521037.1 unnamed protein product [Peronospora belbahrii]